MGTNAWRQCDRAVSAAATICRSDATRFQHREYSLDRRENRFRELERLLHEQIRARGIFTIGPGRIARASDSRAQYLSGGDKYRDLGRCRGRLAAREN